MTDRELLEAAAKAIGGELVLEEDCYVWWLHTSGAFRTWNPLESDGDRYRLARSLGLSIAFDECTVWKRLDDGSLIQEYWGANDGDEAHAIVRAAAALGGKT